MKTRRPALFLLLCATSAFAQETEIQKLLIKRQQQSDSFTLQLRQSQEALKLAPGDLKARRDLESRQTGERQRLDNVSEKQLQEVKPDTPQELRPQEGQRAADERRPLTVPAGGITRHY